MLRHHRRSRRDRARCDRSHGLDRLQNAHNKIRRRAPRLANVYIETLGGRSGKLSSASLVWILCSASITFQRHQQSRVNPTEVRGNRLDIDEVLNASIARVNSRTLDTARECSSYNASILSACQSLIVEGPWYVQKQKARINGVWNPRLSPEEERGDLPIFKVASGRVSKSLRYKGEVSIELVSRTVTDDELITPQCDRGGVSCDGSC